MSLDLAEFQYLLQGMRERFLDELGERCDRFDNLILALERNPSDRETFDELYRGVHSLKGAGGTHGLPIITRICHQLENLLTEAKGRGQFNEPVISQALAYVDLLRRVEAPGRQENPDYAQVEADLERLREATLKSRHAVLMGETSGMMIGLCQKALDTLPVRIDLVDSGLAALQRLLHEPFDLIILGRELKELNGVAVLAALRASQSRNRHIPAILLTSNRDDIPACAAIDHILARDQKLVTNLRAAAEATLRRRLQ